METNYKIKSNKYEQKVLNQKVLNQNGGGVIKDFFDFCEGNENIYNNRNYLKGCQSNVVDLCSNKANIDRDNSYDENKICNIIHQIRVKN
jgi:hypothetical protein